MSKLAVLAVTILALFGFSGCLWPQSEASPAPVDESVVINNGGADAGADADAGVDADAGADAEPKPDPAICDNLPGVENVEAVRCLPGEMMPAHCRNTLPGYRICEDGGISWSIPVCPSWTTGLSIDTTVLFITREAITRSPGFYDVVYSIPGYSIEYVTAESLTWAYPAPTVWQSLHRAIRELRAELPKLKYVVILGHVDPGQKDVNVTSLTREWDIPLPYGNTPPNTNYLQSLDESVVPTSVPYGYTDGEWTADVDRNMLAKIGGDFWRPDEIDSNIHVGYVPLTGQSVTASSGAVETDLQVYAKKVKTWLEGIDKPAKIAFFQGFAGCQQEFWMNDLMKLAAGTQFYVHVCQDTESDVGLASEADARVILFGGHGGPGGSCPAGKYCLDGKTKAGGRLMDVHSCMVGSPDQADPSVGEAQLASPDGATAFVAYSRTLLGDSGAFVVTASRTGLRTFGEAVDRRRFEQAKNLTAAYQLKAMMSYLPYGLPHLPLAPPSAASVKVVARHANADGSLTACVQTWSKTSVTKGNLKIGSRTIATVDIGAGGTVNTPVLINKEEAADTYTSIRLDTCDPSVETCQIAGLDPLPLTKMVCGEVSVMADKQQGTSVSFTISPKQRIVGKNLTIEVKALSYACESRRSLCYQNVETWARRETSVMKMAVDKVWDGETSLTFTPPANAFGPWNLFRQFVVTVGTPNTVVATCMPPLPDPTVEDADLL
ncbi:MAG: hypothetical protein PHT12_05760 [Patescibacteria group bacterium]|nr:hypothetical protein [Patescibacteria group bacterium]